MRIHLPALLFLALPAIALGACSNESNTVPPQSPTTTSAPIVTSPTTSTDPSSTSASPVPYGTPASPNGTGTLPATPGMNNGAYPPGFPPNTADHGGGTAPQSK
jgi:hypothetical protein